MNPLYLVFKTINGYFEEIIGKKYLTIVSTNESTDKIKKNMKKAGIKSEI